MLCEMTDVWLNQIDLYPYRTPPRPTPLSRLLPWKHSGSLANSKPPAPRKTKRKNRKSCMAFFPKMAAVMLKDFK